MVSGCISLGGASWGSGGCHTSEISTNNLVCSHYRQGPVVRTPVSANPGLNFNPGFVFFLSKALSRIIFSILFRVSNHQIESKKN